MSWNVYVLLEHGGMPYILPTAVLVEIWPSIIVQLRSILFQLRYDEFMGLSKEDLGRLMGSLHLKKKKNEKFFTI